MLGDSHSFRKVLRTLDLPILLGPKRRIILDFSTPSFNSSSSLSKLYRSLFLDLGFKSKYMVAPGLLACTAASISVKIFKSVLTSSFVFIEDLIVVLWLVYVNLRVKIMPVTMLSILAAKMMKPDLVIN